MSPVDKRLRWATDVTGGSPHPSAQSLRSASSSSYTGSPGLSAGLASPASSQSSFGPHTPPVATYYHSHIIPLPNVTPEPKLRKLAADSPAASPAAKPLPLSHSHVAPLLSLAIKSGKTRLKWDMASEPLQHAFDRERRAYIFADPSVLDGPALSVDVTRLVVGIVDAQYPYEITVERSSELTAPLFVTVRDVLLAVYANLRMHVTAAEQKRAGQQSPRAYQAAYGAYARRAGGDGKAPMRRIDFLAGRSVFLGLVSAGVDGKLPRLELRVGCREV